MFNIFSLEIDYTGDYLPFYHSAAIPRLLLLHLISIEIIISIKEFVN